MYTWSDCIGELAVIGWWSLAPAATLKISVKRSSRACLLFHLNLSSNFHPRRVSWCTALVAQRRSDRCCSLARFLPSFLPCAEQDCGVRQPWRMDYPLGHRQIASSASLKPWKEKMIMVEKRVRWIWPISDQVCVVCFFSFLAPFSSKFIGNFLRSFPSLRSPKLAYKFQFFLFDSFSILQILWTWVVSPLLLVFVFFLFCVSRWLFLFQLLLL